VENKKLSVLTLPTLRLAFSAPVSTPKTPPALPNLSDPLPALLWFVILGSALWLFFVAFRPEKKKSKPKLSPLLQKKKPELQISKSSALQLYQQLLNKVSTPSDSTESLLTILEKHLPENDWKAAEPVFRALEWTAFSPTRAATVTYKEMKEACGRVEKRWIL
jgi:hypothetical protein